MIYTTEPAAFNPRFEIVGCFVEHGAEILLLHRQDHRPEGNTWGIPSGKIEDGEEPLKAIVREIREETGLEIPDSKISYFGKVFVRFPTYDFIYHIFQTKLDEKQDVRIRDREHKGFRWLSLRDAFGMPVIQDLDACIRLVYKLPELQK